jgi:hypothetical protein
MKPQRWEGGRALEVVVCLDDSVVEVVHLRQPGQIRAGQAPGCLLALPIETLGAESVTLASVDETGQAYVARELGGAAGAVLRPLDAPENASIAHDSVRVLVRWTAGVEERVRGGFMFDKQMARTFAGTAAAMLTLLYLMLCIPPDAKALAGMDESRLARLTHIQMNAQEDAKKKVELGMGKDGHDAASDNAKAGTAAAEGPQGKMGRDTTKTKGLTALEGDKPEDHVGPGDARAFVQNKGVLGVMRTIDWAPVAGGTEEWGAHAQYAYGGDRDAQPGDGWGTFGGGYDGNGSGGCPPGAVSCAPGTIGVGNYRTIGNDPSAGHDPTGTGSHVKMGPKGDDGPKVHFDHADVSDDGLDKAIVKRYIQAQREKFAYCYTRELQVHEDLEGTVGVAFVISPNGAVISVQILDNSTNEAVGSCVQGVVYGIQFPRSEHITNVKYPFTFHAVGNGGQQSPQ